MGVPFLKCRARRVHPVRFSVAARACLGEGAQERYQMAGARTSSAATPTTRATVVSTWLAAEGSGAGAGVGIGVGAGSGAAGVWFAWVWTGRWLWTTGTTAEDRTTGTVRVVRFVASRSAWT